MSVQTSGAKVVQIMAAAIVAIAMTATAAAATAQAFGGDKLWEAWGGKTLTASLASGNITQLTFNKDWTIVISGGASDTGVWKTTAQGYCTRWTVLNGAQTRCFTVTTAGDGKFDVKTLEGAYVSTMELPR